MFHSWTETQPPETTVCFIMCFWFLMLGSAFIPSFIKTDDIAHLTKTPKQSRSQRYQSVPSREETYPPDKAYLKMIFLFPRWDMLIPWRVNSLKFHKVYGLSVVGLFFAKWINNSVSWPSLPTKKKTVLVVSKTIFRHLYLLLSPILTRMIQFHNSTRTRKFAFGVPRCLFFLAFPLEKQNVHPIGSFSPGRMGPNRGPLVSRIQKATEKSGQPGCSGCPKNNRKLTSPPYYMACLKMIFLFQRWEMLVLWRVLWGLFHKPWKQGSGH